jgi:hypothetical protein
MRHIPIAKRCGFAGAKLTGERLVRVTFLDEAGVSNPKEEPFQVVAGIMVDPDRHYGALDARLRDLAEECFPPKRSDVLAQVRSLGHPFIFHAKDVWHGSGVFPRKDTVNWPRAKRLKIFEALSKNPEKFSLNIVWAAVDRQAFLASDDAKSLRHKDREGCLHAFAYFHTLRKIDSWMIENAPREYTSLYAEDRREVKSYIELVHTMCVDRSVDETAHRNAFSSTHIMEPVAFVPKHRAAVLQVADHCAFIIKRKLQGCKDIGPYFENIRPMIWSKSTEAATPHYRPFPNYVFDRTDD